MPDKDKSIHIDINKQDSNIQKGIRTELNEAYIPDYQFTPTTPATPPPATVDTSSSSSSSTTANGE